MESLSTIIRKIAGPLIGEYHPEEVRIYFRAPDPKRPDSDKTLTKETERALEANFQWVAYQMLFSLTKGDEQDYFIYSTQLNPNGTEKSGTEKVFKSDSNWSGKYKDKPETGPLMNVGVAKRTLAKYLKGPKLFPDLQTVYVNIPELVSPEALKFSAFKTAKTYSSEEFKRMFDNDFYIVLDPHKKQLKNPLGKPVGISYPKTDGAK